MSFLADGGRAGDGTRTGDGADLALAHPVRGRRLGPRHAARQPVRHQAPQPEARQRRPVRPLLRGKAASRARPQATSASSGSTTAGSGSFRWPTARPASAPCAGRTT
ncbi:MAG: hypothetical protein MZW92_37800 [Comamonadaceae bacterium]|nr:hypothetical protein [Comamonadaceae bacterium]